ncbi:MAG TPA: hypothetical protein VJ793_05955 [Anaerolineae bacterium]|nr:hypothetical protein [Anaerolineae bacterium]
MSSSNSAAIAQAPYQILTVTLAQVGQAAFDAAEQIAHLFDRVCLYLSAQKLFERQAYDF